MIEWKSKVTEDARRRMVRKSARDQRREAIEFYERSKQSPIPDPDDEDADDASIRRGLM